MLLKTLSLEEVESETDDNKPPHGEENKPPHGEETQKKLKKKKFFGTSQP